MKTQSPELRAHRAGRWQTFTTCWLLRKTNGDVFAVCDLDRDITFNLEDWIGDMDLTPNPSIVGTGSQTYLAKSGFTASNIQSGAGLNVDTGECVGALNDPAITEADLRAGIWDFAFLVIFEVNWADTSMGAMIVRAGNLGEVVADRGFFRAQWGSLAQAWQANYGEVTSPYCPHVFGDARCTKDLTTFTVTGSVDSVAPDNRTIRDSARTEPGPTGGIAVVGITNANPGVVTIASAAPPNGDPVAISGVGGMTPVNTQTVIRERSGNTFKLGVDTTDTSAYPAYTSGGLVTPLGAETGYFDGGIMKFTSGANNGLSMEVRNYIPGQWTLQEPMPYVISPGDTYIMVAGCDHTKPTCRDVKGNAVNFGGLSFLPGWDQMIQIGRHT